MEAKSWWDRFSFDVLPFRACHYVHRQIYASSADCNCLKSAALLIDTDKVLLATEDTLTLTGVNE